MCVLTVCVCVCVCVCVFFRGEGVYRACTHRSVVVVYHAYQCDPWICCAELGSEVCAIKTAHNIQLVSCFFLYLGGGFVRVALGSFSSFFIAIITANCFLFVSLSDCSFQDFVRGELQMLRSHPRPDSTSHHITAGSH